MGSPEAESTIKKLSLSVITDSILEIICGSPIVAQLKGGYRKHEKCDGSLI